MGIDWSKPIEAVHVDGRIGKVEPHGVPYVDGMAYAAKAGVGHIDAFLCGFRDDGSPMARGCEWSIRNTTPTPEQRAMEIVKALAGRYVIWQRDEGVAKLCEEARANGAEMEPVDVDEKAASDAVAECGWADHDTVYGSLLAVARAAIAKGRSLERGEG